MGIQNTIADNDEGDAVEFRIGGFVCFKCDIEQGSEIFGIRRYEYGIEILVDITEGGYEHGKTWIRSTDTWQD